MSQTQVVYRSLLPGRAAHDTPRVKVEVVPSPTYAGDGTALAGVQWVNLDRSGAATLLLDPNSECNPSGSWYRVTGPDGDVQTIVVPVSGTPVGYESCLVDNPQAPGSVQVGVTAGPTPPDHNVIVLWADTNSSPPVLKVWDGTDWVPVGGGSTGGSTAGFTFTDLGNGLASVTVLGSATLTDLGNGLATLTGGNLTDLGNGLASAA